MMENTLDTPPTPVVAPMCRRPRRNAEHMLKKRAVFEGEWDSPRRRFKKVRTDYVRLKCRECNKKCRTFCSCDPVKPLCTGCYALHSNEL